MYLLFSLNKQPLVSYKGASQKYLIVHSRHGFQRDWQTIALLSYSILSQSNFISPKGHIRYQALSPADICYVGCCGLPEQLVIFGDSNPPA